MIDILITALKFAGMLLSGVFGVYGLLVRFRDKDDKITKAGRNALILIIASSAIAVGSQALELIRDRESTLQAVRRTEAIIAEINRVFPAALDFGDAGPEETKNLAGDKSSA